MAVTFVDALAGAICRQMTTDDGRNLSIASPRGVPLTHPVGQRRSQAPVRLGRRDLARVASAIAGQLADPDRPAELPLEAIEI